MTNTIFAGDSPPPFGDPCPPHYPHPKVEMIEPPLGHTPKIFLTGAQPRFIPYPTGKENTPEPHHTPYSIVSHHLSPITTCWPATLSTI